MSVSAFDHPFLSGLVGDKETAAFFTANADIKAMLDFEMALASSEAAEGSVPVWAAERIAEVCAHFAPDMEKLRLATARDGVVVPELIRQLREACGPEVGRHVHKGATSQDVVDTSLMLRLRGVAALLENRMEKLDAAFADLDRSFGHHVMMGHTRMQAAIEIRVSDRIRAWCEPLARHRARLEAFAESALVLQFGGAAGTLDALGEEGVVVREALAEDLGLGNHAQWQSQRDRLGELAGLLSLITGSLGKFGQDIALLAEAGSEIVLAGGGASSAMAHKQNPVSAEVLVSLARFNAAQLSGMHQALVHEQERSGAAWTLEWLTLPQMAVSTGASLRLALELAGNIRSLGRD